MAGPGICVLYLADTCTSEMHTVFNPVAPYGYLISDMYLFMADITNSDSFVKVVIPDSRFDTICTAACVRCDSSTACRMCRLEPMITNLRIHQTITQRQ